MATFEYSNITLNDIVKSDLVWIKRGFIHFINDKIKAICHDILILLLS